MHNGSEKGVMVRMQAINLKDWMAMFPLEVIKNCWPHGGTTMTCNIGDTLHTIVMLSSFLIGRVMASARGF